MPTDLPPDYKPAPKPVPGEGKPDPGFPEPGVDTPAVGEVPVSGGDLIDPAPGYSPRPELPGLEPDPVPSPAGTPSF